MIYETNTSILIYMSNICVRLSNLKSKNLIQIQLIGYLLAILMSPISIDIIVDESSDHVRWINFPILSFITWILLIVLPVVYAYIKRIEYKNICFMVLWIPPIMVFSICLVFILIQIILLLCD